MGDLWSTLIPLIVGSAVVPVQIVVTVVLLRSSRMTAAAWVAGMAAVRLLQGVLFGVVLSESAADSGDAGGLGIVTSGLLLVFAVLFYVTALRTALTDDDPDAPPPKWMTKAESMSPMGAFGTAAGYVAISPKFWVFTLGAIAAISDAHMGAAPSALAFVLFVALALSGNLAVLALATASPDRSATALERFTAWIQRNDRRITIVLGVVFGTWFLVKALSSLGLI